jgi:hypothetical protein
MLVAASLAACGLAAWLKPADALAAGPPTVTKVSPVEGREKGGTKLTVKGTNLAGATAVHLGSFSVSEFAENPHGTAIKLVLPSIEQVGETSVDVTVTTPEGTSEITPADRFSYRIIKPVIVKLATRSGPAAGGTAVEILGENFFEISSVTFGSIEAASYTVDSPGSITAITPAETVGKVKVTVTNSAGASGPGSCMGWNEGPETIPCPSHESFTFNEPTVTSVSPDSGPSAGGTSVTIEGSGFAIGDSDTLFDFGGKKNPAISVECSSITTCTAIAPPHSNGTVNVQARISSGGGVNGSRINPSDTFTYG